MGKIKDVSIPDESEYVEDKIQRELRAKWKPRKKKGGFRMKWTFKKSKND